MTKINSTANAARIAIIYLGVGIAYIYPSDRVVRSFVADPNLITLLQTYKGICFVVLSSLLIFYLVRKSQRKNEKLLRELDDKVRERTVRLEEAMLLAESTSRTKSEFLANMSHELRTPLNAIIGFSEAMINGIYGPINERHREYLNDILVSGENLLGLINDILDLSKVESGSMKLDLKGFSLRELIQSTAGMFKEKAVKHSIQLEYRLGVGVDEIVGDQRKLKQVLVNLVSNALKFTPDGGRVVISARTVTREPSFGRQMPNPGPEALTVNRNFIEITVEDTGIGIDKEDIPKLFQPFHQLEPPFQKRYEGTGLGLFLTKRLIELHGGSIHVESEKGKGAIFAFSIPMGSDV